MGRIVDLCGEVAAAVDDGPGGFVLPLEAREQLLEGWTEEDIEDALGFVTESFLQSELVEASDSLSARLIELLGTFAEKEAFEGAVAGKATLAVEEIGHLARRLDRLEEILDVFRDVAPPDRQALDTLRKRLLDQGIEGEMEPEWEVEVAAAPLDEDEPDD